MSNHDICRSCLRPQAEDLQLRRLDTLLESDGETDTNTTLLDCLLYCTKLNNDENLSMFICEKCCMALQTTYNFIRNTLMAEEVWKKKVEKAGEASNSEVTSSKVKTKYRCKLCGIKLFSKKELKNHGKTHAGELTYDCTACDLSTNSKQTLHEHYVSVHNIEPTADQLKPRKVTKPEEKHQSEKKVDELSTFQEEFLKNTAANINNEWSEPITADQLPADANIATQFIVLPDGSLQALSDSNVLIEYIDPELNVFNANNMQVTQQDLVPLNEPTNMNMNNLIVEELGEMLILPQHKQVQLPDEITAEQITIVQNEAIEKPTVAQTDEEAFKEPESKKVAVKCKICAQPFSSLEWLKSHMLDHKDIPQFFCDKCSFYTFYKIDIKQHYETKHKLQATPKQLLPRNGASIAAANHIYHKCNLCDHKTLYKDNLRRHYTSKHNIHASEVNLQMFQVNGETTKTPTSSGKKPDKCKVVITSTIKLNGHATPQRQDQPVYEAPTEDVNKNAETIDFDFNGDTIFDDSLEEENINTSSLLQSQLMLTSDEEDAMLSKPAASNKCNVCQKTFTTYYKLENHMFLHRGLAPFHCEMCTNLYHTKNELLRHYIIVHKTEPTREMLQAKGDKVNNMANVERITVNAANIPTIMCAKCPFETKERLDLIEHLKLAHNTDNGKIYAC